MKIHILAEEWPMIAGCIALERLYKNDVTITDSGVELTVELLDTLAQKYLEELIRSFSVADRDSKRMKWYTDQIQKNPKKTKEYAAEIRKIINDQGKKIEKYFNNSTEYSTLQLILEQLKNVKSEEDVIIVFDSVHQYEQVAKVPEINEKLTLNFVKSVILNSFFGQTSILQLSFNSKSTEEHIQKIQEDFIEPAKLEMLFQNCLRSANSPQEVIQFLEAHKSYRPFSDWLKNVKKMKSISDIQNYFEQEVLPCSFIGDLHATRSYEEMIFSPLAFSKSNAVNFHWDFDRVQPVPMSAVARLIMFLAPLGMASYTRKIGNDRASDTLRFAGLVLSQQKFPVIVTLNHHYRKLRENETTYGEAIIGLLQEYVDKAKKLKESFYFLEFHSDYQLKKTLLDYYHMPNYLVNYLSQSGKDLSLLFHRDLRDEFLRTVLKGLDPKQVILRYLREAVKDNFHAIGAFIAARERVRILESKKGAVNMKTHDKFIRYIYYRGVDLREKMFQDRGNEEKGPYRASGRKKLEGVAYRLINAVKARNHQAFMDTIFRLHMAANIPVPNFFIQTYEKDGLDFETVGSVFISGLLSDESSKKEEEN